jgi:hypothetical protein
MNEQLDRVEAKMVELERKVDALYASSEKVRKYLLWGFWITVATIVLPLLILPLLIPMFLQSVVLPPGF